MVRSHSTCSHSVGARRNSSRTSKRSLTSLLTRVAASSTTPISTSLRTTSSSLTNSTTAFRASMSGKLCSASASHMVTRSERPSETSRSSRRQLISSLPPQWTTKELSCTSSKSRRMTLPRTRGWLVLANASSSCRVLCSTRLPTDRDASVATTWHCQLPILCMTASRTLTSLRPLPYSRARLFLGSVRCPTSSSPALWWKQASTTSARRTSAMLASRRESSSSSQRTCST
mmetsp:Transcript_8506/g.13073  ORF Transcript_8506/g.13073 Transcript_8506/m.13073 type:complete len:231 (-) Transcript_8506:664-1356(-)